MIKRLFLFSASFSRAKSNKDMATSEARHRGIFDVWLARIQNNKQAKGFRRFEVKEHP